MFIKQVSEQLKKMSEAEKENWILSQAKLLEEDEYTDFLMSLTGEKKVICMPSEREIEEFCRKVENGEICLEYETHYFEFDDNGKYIDDWKVWYNDPSGAMVFLDKVFKGCHDLILLNEYKTVVHILDMVCRLGFKVIESPDSDDFEEVSPVTIEDASDEGLITEDISRIGTDWVKAYFKLLEEIGISKLAEILTRIFEHPVCKKINPDILANEKNSKELFSNMADILNTEILEAEIIFDEKFSKTRYSREKRLFEEEMYRKKEILLNIKYKCQDNAEYKTSGLANLWKQVNELFSILKYNKRQPGGQWAVEEASDICKSLLKMDNLGQEEWKLRRDILSDIAGNGFYNSYGCYEVMNCLAQKLCTNKEEFLVFADMLDKTYDYKKEAAYLFHKYGRDDKYIFYLEKNLGKESGIYIELVNCYKEKGRFNDARRVAEQALQRCRENLTDIFIYLLEDANKNQDKNRYKKLYDSAKRRKGADISLIDATLSSLQI